MESYTSREIVYHYHKPKHATPIRPMADDEDLTGIRVPPGVSTAAGGYIAINPADSSDKWFMTPQQYRDGYLPVPKADDYIEVAPVSPPKPKRKRRAKATTLTEAFDAIPPISSDSD